MKARRKGDTAPFDDVYQIVIGRGLNAKYIPINDVEFEQYPHQLNPEEEQLRHLETIRQQAAIAAMQGLLAQSGDAYTESVIAKEAIIYADALVKILKGE